MKDIMLSIWSAFWTVLGWIWTALQFIPGFDYIFRPVIGVCIAILLYKGYQMLPRRAQKIARENVFPYIKWFTDPPRWWLARRIAPGPIFRSGEVEVREIEKEIFVEVRARRSFKQWLMTGVRWGMFYALAYATYANWASMWPYVSQHLR